MSFIGVQMAKTLGAASRLEVIEDRAVTVRPSSTANFYVDSLDKVPGGSSGDFSINKPQALFNGFFHRIAVGEVVMDWGLPNVAQWWGNNFITIALDTGAPTATTYTVIIDQGFYSVLDVLGAIANKLNTAIGGPPTFSVGTSGNQVGLLATADFVVYYPQVATDPVIPAGTAPNYDKAYYLGRGLFSSDQMYTGALPAPIIAPQFTNAYVVSSPLILGTRYVDIVSPQLTYNQDLKDNTTAQFQRDVLYRWYLAWDGNSGVDQLSVGGGSFIYPFYVLQGYKAFNQRRALPYPKQIRWESKQPIGQVSFQSYDDRGRLIDVTKFTPNANYQFQMSMLLSEN